MLASLLGEYGPKAKLSGNTLILSLPDAVTPVVWTLDLLKDGHGSLSIHPEEETTQFLIVFSGSKKNAPLIEVARYKERSKAIRALLKATEALEKSNISSFTEHPQGEGQQATALNNSYPHYAPQQPKAKKQWGMTILGIIVIVGLFLYATGGLGGFISNPLGTIMRGMNQSASMSTQQAPQQEIRVNPPAEAVGVPMDADNFFGD